MYNANTLTRMAELKRQEAHCQIKSQRLAKGNPAQATGTSVGFTENLGRWLLRLVAPSAPALPELSAAGKGTSRR